MFRTRNFLKIDSSNLICEYGILNLLFYNLTREKIGKWSE